MTAGFVLGEKQRRDEAREQEQQQQQPLPDQQPQESSAPAVAPEDLCPAETLAKARQLGRPYELVRVHRYETDRGTTIWICRDPVGRFYYQSKTGDRDQLVQGVNGLLLLDVAQTGEDAYEATAASDGNKFLISRKQFRIEFTDGRKDQVDDVVSFQ
ncbi:hypothetical protein AB0J83_45520 [Actinoplanes sp. NPDC049596]|uniref:hypothetical protein n=1 Tax=unclassified Actinoplanes TaxID=2626549 RepID=UPI0034152074